ncbi:MAG: PqqD family protein [Lachnospiraceae bacterium]|jgi:hypothetical protein
MSKKKKLSREEAIALYNTYIPVRGKKIADWNVDKKGFVVLSIENKGAMNRIAQKLLKKPRISYIHMDETGSFIWQQMDGETNVKTIADRLHEQFGAKADPLYDRLLKFFEIMESYDFLTWLKP